LVASIKKEVIFEGRSGVPPLTWRGDNDHRSEDLGFQAVHLLNVDLQHQDPDFPWLWFHNQRRKQGKSLSSRLNYGLIDLGYLQLIAMHVR
jgi:hypothetical protein